MRTRRLILAAIAAVLATGSGALVARASDHTGTPSTTSTTGPSTTTSTTRPVELVPTTTTTRAPDPGTSTTAPPTTAPAAGDDGGPGGRGTPRTVPADAQRQIDSVRRTGPNNTHALLAALQVLMDEAGLSPTEAAVAGFGQFPVAGPASFVDDWLFPRYVPSFHLHQGTDIFAPLGTPVRAPFDGVLRHSDGPVGGLAVYVTRPDGTYVYMSHLAALVPDQQTGQPVRQGDVVGFVGNSGNAAGGPTHVHLQLHPGGGAAVNPKPVLDAWIAAAIADVPRLLEAFRASRNPGAAVPAASVTLTPPTTLPGSATGDLPATLWAASANPAAGTLDLAAGVVSGAAGGVRWPDRGAGGLDAASGRALAAAVVDPLFPPAFARA